MHTSAADMDVIAERCAYVYGRSEELGGGGDSGRGTARGVFHGIRACLRQVEGTDELDRRTVLVQGRRGKAGDRSRRGRRGRAGQRHRWRTGR